MDGGGLYSLFDFAPSMKRSFGLVMKRYLLNPHLLVALIFISCLSVVNAQQELSAGFKKASTVANPQTLVFERSEGIGKGKHIVFIANDHEYRSEQTCPAMAKILAKRHGFKCTVLFGVDEDGHIKAGSAPVPGMEALKDADLLFFFTRFMNLPDDQADLLVDYFERGGPAVGIRTSTHCFNGQEGKWAKLNFNHEGEDYLGGLGEQIFGNTWHRERGQDHYGTNHATGALVTPVASAKDHPINSGVGPIHSWCGAYRSRPPADATPLVEVQVLDKLAPGGESVEEKPLVSAGWTRDFYVAPSGEKKDARVVYLSFGTSEDLHDEDARRKTQFRERLPLGGRHGRRNQTRSKC